MHVTPQARIELHGMLERTLARRPESVDGDLSFRLLPASGGEGLGLTLDARGESDEVVLHQGRSVLLLDAATAALLEGLTLDLVETPEGDRLGLLE